MRRAILPLLMVLAGLAAPSPATAAGGPRPAPEATSVLGADIRIDQQPALVDQACPGLAVPCAKAAGLKWVRMDVSWLAAQPKPPAAGYSAEPATCPLAYCYWDRAFVESRRRIVANLVARGYTPVLVVQPTPGWANGNQAICVPPTDTATYASFLGNLVRAFASGPDPVGARYWQVWNEPDGARGETDGDDWIGCFGDPADAAGHGGGRFADFVAAARAAVKAADPGAQVVLGGLALGCDSCPAAKFLRGFLARDTNGDGTPDGARQFDVLDFHAYSAFYAKYAPAFDGDWSWSWAWPAYGSGKGMLFDKLEFVRRTLAAYGAPGKPILVGETGLICYVDNQTPCPAGAPPKSFLEAQPGVLVRTFVRAMQAGLLGVEWYSFGDGGFLESELIDTDSSPVVTRPAFTAMRTLAERLRGATYETDHSCVLDPTQPLCLPGALPVGLKDGKYQGWAAEAYTFCRGGDTLHVMWTNRRGLTRPWPVPPGAEVVDHFGRPVDAAGGAVQVGTTPLFERVPHTGGLCGGPGRVPPPPGASPAP